MRRKLLIPVAAAALALLVAAVAIFAGGHWYLACTSDGAPHSGTDCLGSTPRTDSHLARMFGFWPLVAAGLVAVIVLGSCVTVWFAAWRRRRDQAAD
jgi:hypothetical protein